MILQRIRGLGLLHVTAQSIAAMALFWGWFGLLFALRRVEPASTDRYLMACGLVAIGLVANAASAQWRRVNLLNIEFVKNCRIALRQTVVVALTVLLYTVAMHDYTLSRIFIFSYLPLLYVLLFLSNRAFPRLLARIIFSDRHRHHILICGASRRVVRLHRWMARGAEYGFRTVGRVSDEEAPEIIEGLPHIGRMADLEEIVAATQTTQLVLAEVPARRESLAGIADLCERRGVRLLIVNDIEEHLRRPITIIEDDEFCLIGLRREPLESPFNRVLKRFIDLSVALPVVIFVLPVTSLVVWALQRMQSRGPLFYRQRRNGIKNREFTLLKYRTMRPDHGGEARQASAEDERIFPAGFWLRRLSLDELPQFINVLRSEMSAVGPRPHLAEHNQQFREIMNHYNVRALIKPGVTGLAQVRGFRGEIKRPEDLTARIEADLYYLENWSFLLDWLIVARTVWQIFFPPRTAY